ncbi:MAG TPA: hypothetical protein VG265_00870, partial [Gaiellaceae bacterium]|nr:hypothetical protein [Gaiellaceae bacterium]
MLARHAAPPRAGGLRLAQSIASARTPERIVETSTRLAQGRSIGRAASAPSAAAEIPRPPGMSEFAARWIFGDGRPEGIPIAGEAALAGMTTGRPAFLEEQDAREAQIAEAQAAFRAQPVMRGQVQEATPGGFRLARKPVERPLEPPPLKAPPIEPPAPPATSSERVVEEVRAPGMPARETPSTAAPEPASQAPEPSAGAPVPSPPPVAPVADVPGAHTLGADTPVSVRQTPSAATPSSPAAPPAPTQGETRPAEPATARPRVTVARTPEAPRPQRPAMKVSRSPVPAPVPFVSPAPAEPEPAGSTAEPPATAPSPSRGVLRRALDTVLRREAQPASEPEAAPAAVAAPTALTAARITTAPAEAAER